MNRDDITSVNWFNEQVERGDKVALTGFARTIDNKLYSIVIELYNRFQYYSIQVNVFDSETEDWLYSYAAPEFTWLNFPEEINDLLNEIDNKIETKEIKTNDYKRKEIVRVFDWKNKHIIV